MGLRHDLFRVVERLFQIEFWKKYPTLRPPFGGVFAAGFSVCAIVCNLASRDRPEQSFQTLFIRTSEVCIKLIVDAVRHSENGELHRENGSVLKNGWRSGPITVNIVRFLSH